MGIVRIDKIAEDREGWSNPKRQLTVETVSKPFSGKRSKLMIAGKSSANVTFEGYAKSLNGDRLIERKSDRVSLRDRAQIFNPAE